MRRAWLLFVIAACKTSSGDDEFPVNPNGKGPIDTMVDAAMIDAAPPDGGGIFGHVCLVGDLRGLACATTGVGNLSVTLGTKTTLTNDDGTFTIATPSGSNLIWRVSGIGFVSSVMPFGASTTIPMIKEQDYLDLQGANSVIINAGQGSIIARIVNNNVPQAGATAEANPQPPFATKYDGVTASAWTELATKTKGVAWVAGADTGFSRITITPASGGGAIEDVLVEDQAITYVTIDLP